MLNLTVASQQNYDSNIDHLYQCINSLNNKDLTDEDEFALSDIFDSILRYLDEENKETKLDLKSELIFLIHKTFKIKNISSEILEQAMKIDSILNPLTSSIPKSNIVNQLQNQQRSEQVSSIKSCEHRYMIQHIKNQDYGINIFDHNGLDVRHYDIKDNLVAIHILGEERGEIKFWDLETKKCVNTFNLNNDIFALIGGIEIVDNLIVCKFEDYNTSRIHIIDIKTKKERTLDLGCSPFSFCRIGKQVFRIRNNQLEEGDLEGNFVRIFFDPEKSLGSFIWGSGNFLFLMVYAGFYEGLGKTIIHIYDRLKNKITKSSEGGLVYNDGDRLIIEHNREYQVLDLKTGEVVKSFKVPVSNSEKHSKVIMNQEWVFLGYSSGIIMAVNLTGEKIFKLGAHEKSVYDFTIDRQILISCSQDILPQANLVPAELKFWDLQSMTEIHSMQVPNVRENSNHTVKEIFSVDGKVYITVGTDFIQIDFLDICDKDNRIKTIKAKLE